MNVFLTGATGYIGTRLALFLADKGFRVHALYRSEEKAKSLKTNSNIVLFKGDILDVKSLELAMQGCRQVFHVAACAKAWEKDPSTFYRLNVEGTLNLLNVAQKLKVEKIVFTSTAGIFGPSEDGSFTDETSVSTGFFTDYEKSKRTAEDIIRRRAGEGQHIVIVNPTRVYGPGLLSESNGVTRMVKLCLEGKWHFIPGNGKSIGNYVFVDDVVRGHILAMENGRIGENYILGGENINYLHFFDRIRDISGDRFSLFNVGLKFMKLISNCMKFMAEKFSVPPAITPELVEKFTCNWNVSSNKAITELGYSITPLDEGLRRTITWLKGQ